MSCLLWPSAVEELRNERAVDLDATFEVMDGPDALEPALRRISDEAEAAVRSGAPYLVVTDTRVGPERAAIPSALAAGAVHARLLEAGLRSLTSIVVECDDARETHHIACLLTNGADAVCPRLVLESIASLAINGRLGGDVPFDEAQRRFASAVEDGLLKVMSKMGISTLDSYRGAQIIEAIGLSQEVMDLCFKGVASVLGGLSFTEIGADIVNRHDAAFAAKPVLVNTGYIKHRSGGEYHTINPDLVDALQASVGLKEQEPDQEQVAAHHLRRAVSGDRDAYGRFAVLANERPPSEPRDLLEFVPTQTPVPIEEVEPVSAIVRRFSTGAMSHGALSSEAHETLAAALNIIGGAANSGEGGEAPERYRTERNCRIKQVASGRFGVTPEYLAHADELQIKMAQGSKPGEGGQLPGHKVSAEIARLRHTQPAVDLISPPPHHDIYSIEDLAQLIYDLKQVNAAQVSVKLVAEDGVGTIAAGCVKALADVIHMSGQNGGTGASPLSSIKYAGMPWELGFADTQRALIDNGLRSRARLRVAGASLTAPQVIFAALPGADEYSFGTAAMIAEGCIMLRACHRDTCKPGVATQRPHLRANFTGTPEGVAAYFRFVERVELQDPRDELGDQLLADAFRAVWDGDDVDLSYDIRNADRAIGAALSGAIALEYGELPPRGTARARFTGPAGQSFGAFLAHGVELDLTGDANDYVGKGMGGGVVVIRPPANDRSELPILAGNTCLYGATGGELYIAGGAGERFGVRNSGAVAVIESAGDHCCEYMTGGTILVTGPGGGNLGAGMTGGQAFVFDHRFERLTSRLNRDLVDAVRPDTGALQEVRWLVERHHERTGSARSALLLEHWAKAAGHVWHVLPKDEIRRIEGRLAGTLVAV